MNSQKVFPKAQQLHQFAFSILTDMSSSPGTLFISKDLIVFRISLPKIVIDSREEAVRSIYREAMSH